MSGSDRTTIGDRMKAYEQPSISRVAFKGQPLVARLDGKAFHTFTKGLKRPYDERLSNLMRDTTVELVERFHATVGYTQSDEITLVWVTTTDGSTELPFAGRFQKLDSLLASYASVFFASKLSSALPEKAGLLPHFDCRSFVVPNLLEAYHAVLWRQQDCTKNAISMAAQSMFSHKSLQGLHGPEMQEKMWKEKGVNFNNYPSFFKRGQFARRKKVVRPFTSADFEHIPKEHWPAEGSMITRSITEVCDIWLAKQPSGVDALFNCAEIVSPPRVQLDQQFNLVETSEW